MELTELATVAGPVVGLAGVGLAIWALVYSKQSRDIAQTSKTDSAKAIGLAEKSNEIAADAKGVAEEANTISRRAEDRDTERHDVEWAHVNIEPGVYELRNDGTDTAHRVRVRFHVDGWSVVGEGDAVGPGAAIRAYIPEATREFEREMDEVREERRAEEEVERLRKADPYLTGWAISTSASVYDPPRTHNMGFRVVWQSALGSPKETEENWLEELADHDDYE